MTMTAINTYVNAKDPASPLDIHPVTGTIGAEIRGVRLADDLDESVIEAIKAAVVRHKVVFFRDQHDLTDDRHEAFTARFGDPVAHPRCRSRKARATCSSSTARKAMPPPAGIPT
jgi:taurine dioxygenase